MLDPVPNLDKVFSMIFQQERHLNIGVLPTPSLLNVQALNSASQGYKHQCARCGCTNPTVYTGFIKHGFPLDWKSKKAVNHVTAENFEDAANVLSGLTKDQFHSLIAFPPSTKPTATASALNSSNLFSSHYISTQPPSGNACWILVSGAGHFAFIVVSLILHTDP